MNQSKITALFGGTFDPIHCGHLQVATALATEVGLDSIQLLPNNIPPHKPQPRATALQRLEMLKLAIQHLPLFSIDTRELARTTSSYTIDTLIEWRAEKKQTNTLVFIIGEDALYTLNKWHRWQEILNYCHLLICRRSSPSNIPYPESVKWWLQQHITDDITHIHAKPSGYIYLSNTPITDCSSTEIRSKIAQEKNCASLLPELVWQYIEQHNLYR
jgi:nicotinate-nucleotide adenylyltransferase